MNQQLFNQAATEILKDIAAIQKDLSGAIEDLTDKYRALDERLAEIESLEVKP